MQFVFRTRQDALGLVSALGSSLLAPSRRSWTRLGLAGRGVLRVLRPTIPFSGSDERPVRRRRRSVPIPRGHSAGPSADVVLRTKFTRDICDMLDPPRKYYQTILSSTLG